VKTQKRGKKKTPDIREREPSGRALREEYEKGRDPEIHRERERERTPPRPPNAR
jgi:hypothetical protein